MEWEAIGQVAAAGNSQQEIAYQYIDDNLPLSRNADQIFYYRLQKVDLDGKYQYSDIRGVNIRTEDDGTVRVYPNPTTAHINIEINGWDETSDYTRMVIFNSTGQQMLTKDIIGNGIEMIEVNQLPSGTYNIILHQGDKTQTHRFIKVD